MPDCFEGTLAEMMRDPEFAKHYRRIERRERRYDRLREIRHRLLPFLHDWRGPHGEDWNEARCRLCGKSVPLAAVDNWRGRVGLHA